MPARLAGRPAVWLIVEVPAVVADQSCCYCMAAEGSSKPQASSGSHRADASTSPAAKPIIGLCGGIGSGKSTVARQLAQLGAMVIDADQAAQEALEQPDVQRQLIEWWGPAVCDERGRIDRAQVADRVFGDPEELRRLEGLIHPRVAQQRLEMIRQAERDPAVRAVVWDVPLLFEKQLDRQCDCLIFVHADRAVRRQRVARDRGWDEDELDRREKNQMALDRKRRSVHYTIDNGSSEAACFAQVRDVFTRILTSRDSSTGPNKPVQG